MNVTMKNEIVKKKITSRKYYPQNGIECKLHTVSIWYKYLLDIILESSPC